MGELDVVLLQRLAHAGAGQADDEGYLEEGEVQRRQEQVFQPVPGQEADLDPQKHDRVAAPA